MCGPGGHWQLAAVWTAPAPRAPAHLAYFCPPPGVPAADVGGPATPTLGRPLLAFSPGRAITGVRSTRARVSSGSVSPADARLPRGKDLACGWAVLGLSTGGGGCREAGPVQVGTEPETGASPPGLFPPRPPSASTSSGPSFAFLLQLLVPASTIQGLRPCRAEPGLFEGRQLLSRGRATHPEVGKWGLLAIPELNDLVECDGTSWEPSVLTALREGPCGYVSLRLPRAVNRDLLSAHFSEH